MPVVLVVSVPLIFYLEKRKRNYQIKEKKRNRKWRGPPFNLGQVIIIIIKKEEWWWWGSFINLFYLSKRNLVDN
jgi:hypothetical protein